MDIRLVDQSFERRRLAVRRGTFFRSPALLVDGKPVALKSGCHSLLDDEGIEREVRLHTSAFDPLPRVEIEDVRIAIAPRPGDVPPCVPTSIERCRSTPGCLWPR